MLKIKDVLIHGSSRGTTGRLYNRIRYLKKRAQELQGPADVALPQVESSQHSMDHLLWLKTVVVSDDNVSEIQSKLELTRKQRDEMVSKATVELLQEFPFFFTNPELVGFNDHFLLLFR